MIAFLKALPLGIFLTLVICLFIGSGGSTGGPLNVTGFEVEGIKLYWSWKLFLAGTALPFFILLMMGD